MIYEVWCTCTLRTGSVAEFEERLREAFAGAPQAFQARRLRHTEFETLNPGHPRLSLAADDLNQRTAR